jgi:hypothetical protein
MHGFKHANAIHGGKRMSIAGDIRNCDLIFAQ